MSHRCCILGANRTLSSIIRLDNQMARHRRQSNQTDLFSLDTEGMLPQRLDQLNWPDQKRFPINRASAKVRTAVWSDLESSTNPLMIAGYSSIGELISVVEDWTASAHQGQVRVVLGTEPFQSVGRRYAAPEIAFTREVEDYWLRQSISLRQSSSVLRAIEPSTTARYKCASSTQTRRSTRRSTSDRGPRRSGRAISRRMDSKPRSKPTRGLSEQTSRNDTSNWLA